MFNKLKNNKAFTLIELVVTVGIIGILVLIASTNLSGQKESAQKSAALADAKVISDATDMYNIDNDDWPRLTDVPYTSEELEAYTEKFYDATGKEVTLDENGNYYDIDYDKLSQYAKAPVNKENYILQNPVGKVFYMENLTTEGKSRVDYANKKAVNPSQPSKPSIAKDGASSILVTAEEGTEVRLDGGAWQASPHTFEGIDIGQSYLAEARFKATEEYLASKPTKVNFETVGNAGGEVYDFAYTGAIQEFTVPASGQYKLEVWGAQGGYAAGNRSHRTQENNPISIAAGGKGGYSNGNLTLEKGSNIYIVSGGKGEDKASRSTTGNVKGGYNGGGSSSKTNNYGGGGGGGGATHISLSNGLLRSQSNKKEDIKIVAAGGGGGWGTTEYSWEKYRGLSEGAHGGGLEGGRAGYGGTMGYTSLAKNSNLLNQNDNRSQAYNYSTGGTQSSGGVQKGDSNFFSQSSKPGFGIGGSSANSHSHSGGGGGGGWYGGAGGSSGENANGTGGGGGSGYVGELEDTEMIAGNQTMPNPQGGTMVGNTGHGFARITALDSWSIVEQ